jgi:hypothetical protein
MAETGEDSIPTTIGLSSFWDAASLDRLAWTHLTTTADEILDWLPELQVEAAERMETTGEKPIPTTVGLAVFRSPGVSRVLSQRENNAQD